VLNAFMGTGQSLSQGATAVPLASTYPVAPLTAFMTNLGVRPVADDFGCVATTLAASAITSLVPLQESVASIDGETIASGAMNTIAATLLGHPSQFVLVTPKYFLGYELGDAVHLPAVGEEQLGEKYGEAFFETFFAEPKTPWKPLYATSAAIAGPSVTLHYTVPFPPIVLDTTWVNASYSLSGVVDGFHYTDDSASAPVVTDVAITDPGGEVTRGPSAAPAGTFTTRTRSPRDSRGARARTRPRSRARSRPRTGARSSSTRPSRRASSTPGKSSRSPG
jgi:hypothetical protein